VPLDAYRGQTVTLVLEASPGPAGNSDADRAGWGLPWLMEGVYEKLFEKVMLRQGDAT
jgi:hypothetical protein